MPPKITGQYLQGCIKGINLDLVKLNVFEHYKTIENRAGTNANLAVFINAYMLYKLKEKQLNSSVVNFKEELGKINNIIVDKFDLNLPLDDWFNKLIEGKEASKTEEIEFDEKKVIDINIDDVYEEYGTQKVKEFYKRHPESKPATIQDVTINVKNFNEATKFRDLLHDKSVSDWEASVNKQIEELQKQEEERVAKVEESKKPENWKRIDVKAKTQQVNAIGEKSDRKSLVQSYAEVKQNNASRHWYDYIFHPIRTYQENSLLNNIAKRLIAEHDVKPDQLDTIFQEGTGYVKADIQYQSDQESKYFQISRLESDLELGYDKVKERDSKKLDNVGLRNRLSQSIDGNAKSQQIGERVQGRETNKSIDGPSNEV